MHSVLIEIDYSFYLVAFLAVSLSIPFTEKLKDRLAASIGLLAFIHAYTSLSFLIWDYMRG